MGCLYGFIFFKYYKQDDTWFFYHESLTQYQTLLHQPKDFFMEFLPQDFFAKAGGFWQGAEYYKENLEYCMMVKPLAILNIFTASNYYINVLFFDFVAFIGLLIFYKLLAPFFISKKNGLIFLLFFLPLTSFWLSGIRAEGLLLLFTAMCVYYSYKWMNVEKKMNYILYVLLGIFGCIILRGQFLLAFFPSYLALMLSWKRPQKSIFYFGIVYLSCMLVFCGSLYFSPQQNLASAIIQRQQDFLSLQGNTIYKLDPLEPTLSSFIKIFPQAFSNAFLRPFIWEAKGFLQLVASLDVLFLWLSVFLAFVFRNKEWKTLMSSPLILFFLIFGLSQIILIGYIVPFPGAIVRYKSIPELFIFFGILWFADLGKMRRAIHINKL